MSDRMFRVIVAGGMALVSTAPSAAVVSCGSSDTTSTSTSSQGDDASADGFPSEGPPMAADAHQDGTQGNGDGALSDQVSTGNDGSGGGDADKPDGFPKEGPVPVADF